MWNDVVAFVGKFVVPFASGAIGLAILQRFAPALGSGAWHYFQSRRAARRVVAVQLDPLLKAADELYGKLLSLAKEDFSEFRCIDPEPSGSQIVDLCSTMFLFAQVWARLEILRCESFHAELVGDKTGKRMLDFVKTLESRQVRLVDRAWQRAMGESLIGASGICAFRQFVEDYEQSPRLRQWFEPLVDLLRRTDDKVVRQRVLRYGVIVQAFIDVLDPKHHSSKDRPGYSNKLSRRSRKDLKGRMRLYSPYVQGTAKYLDASAPESLRVGRRKERASGPYRR